MELKAILVILQGQGQGQDHTHTHFTCPFYSPMQELVRILKLSPTVLIVRTIAMHL